jgi:dihydropteroate synthase
MPQNIPIATDLDSLIDAETSGAQLWLRPLALLAGKAATRAIADGLALPLAGGNKAFAAAELLARRRGGFASAVAPLPRLRSWAEKQNAPVKTRLARLLAALSEKRAPWAGLALDRPVIMGILNVTPDSFSDGGSFIDPVRAIAHGRALLGAGADIIDVGGESTRPGAQPISPQQELERVEQVVRELASAGALISIDTRHANVMEGALAAGARIVNDITALSGDPRSPAVAARAKAHVVLMHMQGEPQTMQAAPLYDLASVEIAEYLDGRIAACEVSGVAKSRIVVDPGIGFGKGAAHNFEILARIGLLHGLGCGVLIGVSRKSVVGGLANAPIGERLPGSLAGALHAYNQGVQILRVHDVAETRQAISMAQAIEAGA